jgi:DNA-binding NarL/FixJ family response regulator
MNVVIADDHGLFRELVGQSIPNLFPGSTVIEALDATDAIQKSRVHCPDLVLLDLHMAGLCSFEAGKQIKSFLPKAKVAILTGSADAYLALRSKDYKLNGFLLKGDSVQELKRAIETMMQGGYYMPPYLSQILRDPTLLSKTRDHTLTPRQLEVLAMLFGQSLGVKEAARILGISKKTVESHRGQISQKMNNANNAQLTYFCYQMKLVSEGQLELPQPAHV